MAQSEFTRKYGWGKLSLRTDFTRPETTVEYATDGDGAWEPTPFQAANFYTEGAPDRSRALSTVNRWLAQQAG